MHRTVPPAQTELSVDGVLRRRYVQQPEDAGMHLHRCRLKPLSSHLNLNPKPLSSHLKPLTPTNRQMSHRNRLIVAAQLVASDAMDIVPVGARDAGGKQRPSCPVRN